jgi:hypothetical protein
MTGIIEFINAFVILDDLPVIFIGVGILKSAKYGMDYQLL